MNKEETGRLRQPGLKQLKMRLSAFAVASGFVFTGAADFAKPLTSAEHSLTETAEPIVERIDISLFPLQAKAGNQLPELEQQGLVSNLSFVADAWQLTSQNPLENKQTQFLEDVLQKLQDTVASLNPSETLSAEVQTAQQETPEQAAAEKNNAENNTQKTTQRVTNSVVTKKETTTQPPVSVQETTTALQAFTQDVPETTAAQAPVLEETAPAGYPLSVATISRKQVPESMLFDASGAPLSYSRVIEGKASAYYQGSRTATGTKPMPGTVAVNPRQIPYGSKLWIVSSDGRYTYGYAVAEDTGGFTKWSNGPVVDLYMSTSSECYSFGVRNVKIYVLN